MYQPKFSYSHSIVKDLMSIERSRAIVELIPIPAHIESDFKKRDNVRIPVEGGSGKLLGSSFLSQEKQHKTPITEDFIIQLHLGGY